MKQIPGKMYLSDERGLTETAQFRRYSTFSFGGFFREHKQAFGSLYAWNEETVAASQRIAFTVDEPSYVILLPITGALHLFDAEKNAIAADVEEILVHRVPANHSFAIANPYPDASIHFLHIWLRAGQPVDSVFPQLFRYDFHSLENQLTEIVPGNDRHADLPFSLSLGQFAGRKEAVYSLKNSDSSCFAFVLAGAFELEGRLLHEKDGVALWHTDAVELEALSENVWIVVIELVSPA